MKPNNAVKCFFPRHQPADSVQVHVNNSSGQPIVFDLVPGTQIRDLAGTNETRRGKYVWVPCRVVQTEPRGLGCIVNLPVKDDTNEGLRGCCILTTDLEHPIDEDTPQVSPILNAAKLISEIDELIDKRGSSGNLVDGRTLVMGLITLAVACQVDGVETQVKDFRNKTKNNTELMANLVVGIKQKIVDELTKYARKLEGAN